MTIGAITGLYQQKIKRLLAYSTILNMGYVLIGLVSFSIDGLQSLFFYLLIYLFTNIGVFTLLLSIKELRNQPTKSLFLNNSVESLDKRKNIELSSLVYITDLQKLRNQPLLAFSFTLIIASFAGFPPLAGFFAKLYIFFSAISFQYYVLLFVAVIMSVISCFYYLRLIKYIYFSPVQTNTFIMPISFIHSIIISIVVLFLIVFMFYPGPLLTLSLSLALNILA
jgi:NADH-quinone oxidoreductase subunit N